MPPPIVAIDTTLKPPVASQVVVIGGGVVGLMSALVLAERGVSVALVEKGRVAGEQSSRNLGWVRKMGRGVSDLPLAMEAERLWREMAQRTGRGVGYAQTGAMYLVRTQAELDAHAGWLDSVAEFGLDSRLVTPSDIEALLPGGKGEWAGGLYTPSDGKAEPALASEAFALAAQARGVTIVENCAARSLERSGGAVSAVVTERGTIKCDTVILAGGFWSRRFLDNLGISYPTLPACASVLRTKAMDGPGEICVGGPDFSFRKCDQGGYVITQRGAFKAPIVPDTFRIGHRYLPTLRQTWNNMRIEFGQEFLAEMKLPGRWQPEERSPFEMVRVKDPAADAALNQEALDNLAKAWPVFGNAEIEQSWGGMIEITPDSHPVISTVDEFPGLVIATGFSGHGFGTSPAAGQLAADLAMHTAPLVDPAPYRLDRF